MKVLIVVGYDLQQNNSANLCHLSYINGFVHNGCDVTVLTAKSELVKHDDFMIINENAKVYRYSRDSILSRIVDYLNKKKKYNNVAITVNKEHKENTKSARKSIRNILLDKRYLFDHAWIKRASTFKSDEYYDYVISLAYPPASHKVACNLIKRKRILCGKYIEIWEDPWTEDLFFTQDKTIVIKEEEYLLDCADIIYYVSPITLNKQKEIFKKQSEKMKWMPLPTYYESNCDVSIQNYAFGYFGDFVPYVRDLSKFYEVMKNSNYTTYICGNPYGLYSSYGNVHVSSRLPLQQLRELENKTSVLVFLCNLKGGQIPGKLYQYIATNKIILFILDGTPKEKKILFEYFSKFDRFVFCENTMSDIKRAVEEITSSKYDNTVRKVNYFLPAKITKKILMEECEK